MTDKQDNFRPYASPANVTAVLKRIRSRNLPEIINTDFLRVVGVPEAVFGRVIQALKFLTLIHDDGRPTSNLSALSGARDADYQQLLSSIVREAYKDDFAVVDPSHDTQSRIIDCFRQYQPRSQTARMVMLFTGLCREAGIPVLDAPRERKMSQQVKSKTQRAAKRDVTQTAQQSAVAQPTPALNHRTPSGMLFGVTEEDIGLLGEDEFNEVWGALGKIARARARSKMGIASQEADSEEDLE